VSSQRLHKFRQLIQLMCNAAALTILQTDDVPSGCAVNTVGFGVEAHLMLKVIALLCTVTQSHD